jgi:adenine-specific DNA methylase
MSKVMLELFAGTGSVGKIAKKMGYKVISVDNEEKFKPSILVDINKWNFKTDARVPKKIDFIWASPPCTSFSILNYSMKQPHRSKEGKPLTETGRLGNSLLNKTLAIIKHYKKQNPSLKFTIENPRGMMRLMPGLKKFNRTTTAYSQYGFPYVKATDFWSNFPLELKPVDTEANPSAMRKKGKLVNCQEFSRSTLYRIPGPLIKSILKQANKNVAIE